jgi:hypothetical protein
MIIKNLPKPPLPGKALTPKSQSQEPVTVSNQEAAEELLFNTILIYGPSGSYKTTQIGYFSEYIYELTGKQTRLISMDGGGWGPVQAHINAGFIDAWRITEEEEPMALLRKAGRGAWPKKIGKNGIRIGDLDEPTRDERPRALRDVGAYAIEGLSSISRRLLGHMANKNIAAGQASGTIFMEGDEQFGSPSQGQYGSAHAQILDLIRGFSSLPVERVLYTALEGKGQDDFTKKTVFGPEVVGKALTASIPQYVGDCLHFDDFTIEKGKDPSNEKIKLVETGTKVWFQKHPDADLPQVFWPAKPRLIASKVEEFKRRLNAPNGYFIASDRMTLREYLRVQDEILVGASEELKRRKEEYDKARQNKLNPPKSESNQISEPSNVNNVALELENERN